MLYIDPPYRTADLRPYKCSVNFRLLDEILMTTPQDVYVAISGYGTDYDFLGWRRVERIEKIATASKVRGTRKEVLWMNYCIPATLQEFGSGKIMS